MSDRSVHDFEAAFATISERLAQSVGHRLFTVSRILPDGVHVERIYTNQPETYPVHGQKPRDTTEWTARMERGECFVANHPDDFGPHFSDLDAIVANGFGAVVNIPVHDGDRLLGNLNLLDRAGAYAGSVLDPCIAVQAPARQAFFLYEQWIAARTGRPA